MKKIFRFNSISEFHKFSNLPSPEHPLISLIDYSKVKYEMDDNQLKWIQDFYSIGLKRNVNAKFNYGQQEYDFDNGILSFIAPNQFLKIEINNEVIVKPTGFLLLIHPDFIWNTTLTKRIKGYDFFGYAANEALFLSEKEENIILNILHTIQNEYSENIDKFSQNIIVAQLEVLLNYCERFYQRQFFTRKKSNNQLLEKFENSLNNYIREDEISINGFPTVLFFANELNISPNYLGSILKSLTGFNTQQHIQIKIVEKAKELLTSTELNVSEIAYQLGFEHPQSFSKLFKKKVAITPLQFRSSYN